ncbi:MAG: O-antigen ligase C-terminal domain-containing protein [Burkholderiales bacterium]|nr:O-antigen ligase C-terminal domain-containing protein [Burkholderiales bacterium]
MVFFFAALLLGLSWLVAEHFPPWISWHNEVFAFAAVLWLSAAGIGISRNQRKLRIPNAALFFLCVGLLVCIQFALSQIDFFGDIAAISFYLTASIFALTCGFNAGLTTDSKVRNHVDYFAIVVVIGSVISAVIVIAQVLEIWEGFDLISRMSSGRRPGANLNQPNQLATLLLMGVVSLVYLFDARRLTSYPASFIALLLAIGFSITESRTGLISFMGIVAWWVVRKRRHGSRISLPVTLVASGVFAAAFWFWPRIYTYIFAGGIPVVGVAKVDTSVGTRMVVWPQLMDAAMLHPWFGWGAGGVSKAQNAVIDKYVSGEPFTYAHNIILDLVIGFGIPIAFLLVAFVTVWLWKRVRLTKDLVTWYGLAIALPLGVHSMLEFPFAYAYLLFPVVFMIGVVEARVVPVQIVQFPRWLASAGVFICLVVMGWSVLEYVKIEEDFRVARFESLGMGKTPDEYQRPTVFILTQLDALSEVTRTVPAPGMKPDRIELIRKVAIRFPGPATQNRYALSLALNGYTEEARRQIKVIRTLHGEATYRAIMQKWHILEDTKYPQLREFIEP